MKNVHPVRILLAAYLLYVLCTAFLPYLRTRPVSQDFADSVRPEAFYGESPCVDRVALVETPEEGLKARLHLLDEARERIDVSYYAIHMGETTDLFLGALLNAADRGVQVRILVDGMFGGLTGSHRSYAVALGAHPNIELKLYNPPSLLKPWTWNGRLHDKYIIIDDRLLLLGGRNIGDKYFDGGETEMLSFDRDVLVYNTAWQEDNADSALYSVREYMDGLWDGGDVRQPFASESKKGAAQRTRLLAAYNDYREENPALFDHSGDDYRLWTCPANRISFIHNDTNPGPKEPKAGYVLSCLLLDARESATLQSPYVILDSALKSTLTALGGKDIDVRILTNSMASSPNPTACAAYLCDRQAILRTGLPVYEYQGDHSIHAKAYVIDGRLSLVGSYNLDPRSAGIDTELMLAIDSPEFARRLSGVQSAYLDQSLALDSGGACLPDQACPARRVSILKQVMLWVLRPLVRLFKCLT